MSTFLRSIRTRGGIVPFSARPWLLAALGLLPLLGAQAQQRSTPPLSPTTTVAPRLLHPEVLTTTSSPAAPATRPAPRPLAQHRTTAAIASTATGGNWSSPTTWVGGAVPTATDDVTIAAGATVTLDVAAVAGSLTISTGGSLVTSATTAYSLQVGGSVTNNGTLTMSASSTIGSDLRFVGAGNATFSGTGTTDLFTMSLAKSVLTDVVEMNLPSLSVKGTAGSTTGFFSTRTTNNTVDDMTGTLKISGTAAITNRVFGNAAAYFIPATGAFWLNNANFVVSAQTGSPTVNGQLRLTAGAFNVGSSSGNSILFGTGSTLTVEGGTLSSAGRIGNFTGASTVPGAMTFVQSGGTINVSTVGNAAGTPSFGIAGNLTMTGGTVNLVQRSTATTPLDYYVAQYASTNTLNLSGGTVVAGTGATATNFDFRMRGNVPSLTVDNTTNPKTVQLANSLFVYGTTTVLPTATLILNAFTLYEFGPAIANNGTLNGSATSSALYFAGSAAQTLGGSGTFTAPLKSLSLDNSGGGVTLTVPLTVGRVNFFTGPLLGANRLTIGDGTAVFNYVQYGATGITYAAGTFDAAPTFNIGSGALSLIYAAEAARTTGFEIPATRTVDAVSISNANGVTLAGGNLTINASGVSTGSLTLTSGILTTSATNKVTIGKAAATLPTGSATSYVKGPLGITVNSATAVARTFAVGDAAGWRPVVVGGITTTADQTYTATVVSGATGGSGALLTLNPTRYVRLENTTNLPATATVQLSYGADDTGITAASVVAQAATASGAYTSLGGAAATTPTTGIVSTQNLTPGNDFFVLANPAACNATFGYAATSYCTTGTNPTPSAPGTTNGTFTSTTGLSLNAQTGQINLSASTPGTYTVTYTAAGTCTGTTTVTITAPATAGFSYAAASYCTSATATATPTLATGATAGTFSSTTGLTLDAATGAITPSTSTPGTYTVTNTVAAAGGCAAATSTFTVTITAPATAGFSYPATAYCTTTSGPVTATLATGATAGTYSSTSGLTLNAATGAITPASSTPGTYTVTNTVAAAGGCAATTATTTVTITAPSAAGFSYANASYCTTATGPVAVTLATGATAGTYTSTTGLTLDAATGAITPSTSTPGTYTVTNTVAASGGCAAVTSTATVTITAPATAGFSYAAPAYCTSATATVTPTLATGATAGTFSSTTGLTLNATTGAITPATSTPGTYTVTNSVAASSGCAAVTSTATVTITAPATAGFSYASPSYCSSATSPAAATLATGATAGTFSISPATGLPINATTGALTLSGATPGTYTVTNTVAAAGGCAAVTSTATVTITAPAVATFSYPATGSTCAGSTGSLTATLGTGATAGTFSSTTGLSLNATTGAINLATSTAGTYTVTNTVAASGGCAAVTATATITLNPTPAQPTVTVAYGAPGVATLTSSAATGNQWYLGPNPISGATAQTYVANGSTNPGAYTVRVTSAAGCTSVASAPLTVTASTRPLAGSSLTLFPNPTPDGQLTLELRGYRKAVELTLLNAVGQVVQRHQLPAGQAQLQLDLTKLPAGVYVLRATSDGSTDMRRIVRE